MRKQALHPRTAIINKKQKNDSRQMRIKALQWLAQTFPKAFDNTIQIRPLKSGIMDDILVYANDAASLGISKSKLREAVVLFTRRIDYLASLKAREMRVDLEGRPVAAVTEEEAERAALKIKKRVEKSAKNVRKNMTGKTMTSGSTGDKREVNLNASSSFSYTADRAYDDSFSYKNSTTQQPAKAASVIVKRKPARQYDPEAVARLKEKLGLSRKQESVE